MDEEYYDIETNEEHKDISFYVKPGEIVQIQPGDDDVLGLDEVAPHRKRIFEALKLDNDDEFVKLVTGKHDLGSLKKIGLEFSPSLLLYWILAFRSIKCAQAMIAGKLGLDFDLSSPLIRKDIVLFKEQTPLHVAVRLYALDFVELFLNAGARPDVPCQIFGAMMLPIDQVLLQLGEWTDWTPDQSVYVLIFDLCNHCDLIVYLKMISLLLHHSSVELAREVLYRYAREGRATELAVLLYADSIFGVDKFDLDCADYKALRLSFAEEVAELYQEEIDLTASGNGRLTDCVSKRQGIISVLLVLEVFQRTNLQGIGPDVTVEKLATKLQCACLDLNGTFKYFLKDLPARGVWMQGGEKKLDYLPSFLRAQHLLSPMPVARMLGNEQRTVLAHFFNGKQDSSAVPVLARPVRGTQRGPKGELFAPGSWILRRVELFMKGLMQMRRA